MNKNLRERLLEAVGLIIGIFVVIPFAIVAFFYSLGFFEELFFG